MTKKVAFIVFLLVVALAGALVWAIQTRSELGENRKTLSSTRTELAVATAELEGTKERLADTTDELTSTRSELTSTRHELVIAKSELASTGADLTSTRNQLSSAQQASESLKAKLSSTEAQLSIAQETLEGLGISLYASEQCYDVALIDNSEAVNPTWSQLMTFLSQDQTEKHPYTRDVYDCSHFSRDVHNNAEKAGIRVAEVQVSFENEKNGHALNAFLTTDYGMVYVDCTQVPDKIARVETGKEFRAVGVSSITGTDVRSARWWGTLSSYYYFRSSTGGHSVTSSIRIYW